MNDSEWGNILSKNLLYKNDYVTIQSDEKEFDVIEFNQKAKKRHFSRRGSKEYEEKFKGWYRSIIEIKSPNQYK